MVTDRQAHRLTDRLTEMQHTDPVQYTVLGWVKKLNRSSAVVRLY